MRFHGRERCELGECRYVFVSFFWNDGEEWESHECESCGDMYNRPVYDEEDEDATW